MTAYCARSIADIMETFLSGEMTNSFKKYHWNGMIRDYGRKGGGIFNYQTKNFDMRLSYGELTCTNDHSGILTDSPPSKLSYKASSPEAASNTGYAVSENLEKDYLRNPAFGISLGMQSISDTHGSHVRGLVEAEVLVDARRVDYLHDDWDAYSGFPQMWALTLGYSGIADIHEHANGPMARLIFPLPQVNL